MALALPAPFLICGDSAPFGDRSWGYSWRQRQPLRLSPRPLGHSALQMGRRAPRTTTDACRPRVDRLHDRYAVDAEALCKGAFGTVFKAVHKQTGDECAIKVLKKSSFTSNRQPPLPP